MPGQSIHDRVPVARPEIADGSRLRIVIAAALRLYREGIAMGLQQRGVEVVGATGEAAETAAMVRELTPQVLLLDLSMPSARPLVRSLVESEVPTRIVAFAIDEDQELEVLDCVEMGVAAWVGRDASTNELHEALVSACRGELHCTARVAGLLSRRLASLAGVRGGPTAAARLTPRESEVAELLKEGLSNKSIARSLSLGLPTVKNHVHNILEKLGARTRAEAGARLRDGTGFDLRVGSRS